MDHSPSERCLLRVPALALAMTLFFACATTEKFAPRRPGDRCLDVCPQGMYCQVAGAGGKMAGGQCELDGGRCITDADCHNHVARCVGASSVDVGYCDYPLPLGP